MRPGATVALAASLLAHGTLVLAVSALRPRPASQPAERPPTEIAIQVLETALAEEPAPAPPQPTDSPTSVPRTRVATRTSLRYAPRVEVPEAPPNEPPPVAEARHPRAAPSFIDRFGGWTLGPAEEPLERSADAPATDGGADAHRMDDRTDSMSDALARSLAEATVPPHLSSRPPPRLRRNRRGGYDYAHHVFDATIDPDGTVRFDDRANPQMDPFDPLAPNGLVPSGTFDLTDAFMRDPYRHEKEWFLRSTEALRHRLADAYEARLMRRGAGRMRRRLAGVWADRSRTVDARRAALFDLWDECADDATGTRGRELIEDFIRTTLPRGSTSAFAEDELATLNARRTGRRRFNPYD